MGMRMRYWGVACALFLAGMLPSQSAKADFVVTGVRNPIVVLDHLAKNTGALLQEVRLLVREEPALISYGFAQSLTVYGRAFGNGAAVGWHQTNWVASERINNQVAAARKAAVVLPFLKLNDEALRMYELGFKASIYMGPAIPGVVLTPFQNAYYQADYMGFRNMMASLWILTDGLNRVYFNEGALYMNGLKNPALLQMRMAAINHYARNIYNLMLVIREQAVFGLTAYYHALPNCYFTTYPFRPFIPGQAHPAPYPFFGGTVAQPIVQPYAQGGPRPAPGADFSSTQVPYDFNNWQYQPGRVEGYDPFTEGGVQPPAGAPTRDQLPQGDGGNVGFGNPQGQGGPQGGMQGQMLPPQGRIAPQGGGMQGRIAPQGGGMQGRIALPQGQGNIGGLAPQQGQPAQPAQPQQQPAQPVQPQSSGTPSGVEL